NRVGAAIGTVAIIATAAHVWYHHRDRRELTRPATLLLGLVTVQIALGGLTVLSRRDVLINSLHVVCGALVLATSLVLTLRSWRLRFEKQPQNALNTQKEKRSAVSAGSAVKPGEARA